MKLFIVLVLLLACLASVYSFTLSSRWVAKPQITTRIGLFPDTFQRQLDEVYIGDLPSTFDVLQVKELLQQRHVSGYVNVSVSSYDTSDGDKFASVLFESSSLASSAVRKLQGLGPMDKFADVSLMPNVSTIFVKVLNPCSASRLRLPPNENIVRLKAKIANNETVGAFIECVSPPHAARVLKQLSVFDWKEKNVQLTLLRKSMFLVLNYLDPTISKEGLTVVLNELLGPEQFKSVSVSVSTLGESYCKAYLRFACEEHLQRAIEILPRYKLMDKVLRMDKERKSAPFHMIIKNIDPNESVENIKKLCNEAVGNSDAVGYVRSTVHYYTGAKSLSFRVFFANRETCALCAQTLNGHVWKGKTLFCKFEDSLEAYEVFIPNIPISWSEEGTYEILQKHLGNLRIIGFDWREENVKFGCRYVFVQMFSEEEARLASEKLNAKVGGVRLKASLSRNRPTHQRIT